MNCEHEYKNNLIATNIKSSAELNRHGKFFFKNYDSPYDVVEICCLHCNIRCKRYAIDRHQNYHEEVTRLPITQKVERKLYLRSGNQCAHPKCDNKLLEDDDVYAANICHIEAASIGGPRFNPLQTNEQRRSFDNLILLCPQCHKRTDNVSKYDVEAMYKMKLTHEAKYREHDVSKLMTFIDYTQRESLDLPLNLDRLNVKSYIDEPEKTRFHACSLEYMKKISKLPRVTRQFFAKALYRALYNGSGLSFDCKAMEGHLQRTPQDVLDQVNILECHNLVHMSRDFMDDPETYAIAWFASDKDLFELSFLIMIKQAFQDEPDMIDGLFVGLNFDLLERG